MKSLIFLAIMTQDITDEVLKMDESNTHSLTPRDQVPEATPSPTGYRDYKPPAEVLSGGYQRNIGFTKNISPRREFGRDIEDTAHKTILLGDSGVGKTSLLVQFDTGSFSGNFAATVGIGFTNKVVNVGDTRIKLQIWDTAGQERFRSVTHAYYRDAHGNKSDCGNERVIKIEDGKRLADEYQVPFMETSAKTGLNVELAFLAIAKQLKARKSGNPDDTKFNVRDYVRQESQQKRSTCFSSNCQTT
ncbi:ras-related protein Rab-37 isoform X4 [Cotesia typhae]|uniref:ras-related protein Rab-37 isoform X4 n=1 Tax=Cotesia typhae TaxID=2053667 RepID=UPI003D696EE1